MSKKFKPNINTTNILLTEGDNDCHVILALCKHYAISVAPETFELDSCDGSKKVLKRLNALLNLNTEEKKVIGVVLDADDPSHAAKWQAFQDVLTKRQINCPANPDENGTIIPATGEYPKIGLWLMPNNRIDGMLEDFCLTLADDNAIAFAQHCVTTAQEKGHASFKANHRSKAIIHTHLAWQDEPGKPLGQAITANVLNPAYPLAKTFADWLKALFSDS
jgi:hypothetical protein